MKFTYTWLKEHLDTDVDGIHIANRLTSLGLEVESLVDMCESLRGFLIVRVVGIESHPHADTLKVCRVDTGSGEVLVVCGAANTVVGMKSVYARAGMYIPGTGVLLESRTIRGVVSEGMLCSEYELGLSDEREGIIELGGDVPVGEDFISYTRQQDYVIDIGLTPNRADCAGVRGVARELATVGVGHLRPLDTTSLVGSFTSPITVTVSDTRACPLFLGRYIRGVRNKPSPAWMVDRLHAIGLRSISSLVDITNYLTFDLARPLHVFDADKLQGHTLNVRLSCAGETLDALNGKSYTLDDTMTTICDEGGVVALGGVVGGEGTGCTLETTNVFVECALFDAVRTAFTARKLNILSDAAYRFERGVDGGFVFAGMEACTRMILDLCGGEASEVLVVGTVPEERQPILYDPSYVKRLGGTEVPLSQQLDILERLGFTVIPNNRESFFLTPPSWRQDIQGVHDIVEEVLRIYGFENIPIVPLTRQTTVRKSPWTIRQKCWEDVRRVLAVRGLDEMISWSFMSLRRARLFGFPTSSLRLRNPITTDLEVMRGGLVPNLLDTVKRNRDRGMSDVGLFEVGPVYLDPTLRGQKNVAAGVRSGFTVARHWNGKARKVDVFDVKGDVMALLEFLGVSLSSLCITTQTPLWYHPARSGEIRYGERVLGYFGEVHPQMIKEYDIKDVVGCFEVFLDEVPIKETETMRSPLRLSPFQAVVRDFAFTVDPTVTSDRLIEAVWSVDSDIMYSVDIFDMYTLGEKKSVGLTVVLQPYEKTLNDIQIEQISQQIISAVHTYTQGVLR